MLLQMKCLNIAIKGIGKEGNIDSLQNKIKKNCNMFFSNLPDCRETGFVKSYVKLLGNLFE